MDKESGVYLTITDNSFETPGTSGMKVLIPMQTTKGELGLNLVNANNFKDILGYDLKYNSNYYGLNNMLQNLQYAYVWRLNQGAKLANAYFENTTDGKKSSDNAETFEEITNLEPKPILAISLKNVGDPQTTAVKFAPTPLDDTRTNEFPSASVPQELKFEDVSETEKNFYGTTEIKGGCIFYDAIGNTIVGIIKPNYNGTLSVYKVVDGEIVDDVISEITANTWTDGTTFYGSDMLEMEEPEGEYDGETELGIVRESSYTVHKDAWSFADKFWNEDEAEITEPTGTAGTPVSLGEAYIAGPDVQHLNRGAVYMTDDVGTNFYIVTKYASTFAGCVKEQITDADALTELGNLYSGNNFSEIDYVEYTEELETGFYTNKEGSWFKVLAFSTTMLVLNNEYESNPDIIAALEAATDITISYRKYSREVLTQDNSCGTAAWEESVLTVTLVKSLSRDSYYTVKIIPTVIKDWTLSLAYVDENKYTVQNTVNFSTNAESDIYWNKVDFGEINFYLQGNIAGDWAEVRDYFTIDNGSNGEANIIASELDMSILEKSECNIIAMNGITNHKVINKIAQKGEKLFMHTFADAPAFSSYTDLYNWSKNVYASEYLAIGARPDQVEIADKEYIYVYPSVNYVAILARMQSQYQSLNYPPAGFTYGTIAVENLIECDYENYGDELKTNRINWQRTKNRGSVMWEQRTTYANSTDLSYIAPVFILDGLREQLIDFEEQFNFRYMSPTDLLNQESGIKSILDTYVTRGFIYRYELDVPTYTEAQEAGRVLTIKIGVALAKDAEVIYININLNNE